MSKIASVVQVTVQPEMNLVVLNLSDGTEVPMSLSNATHWGTELIKWAAVCEHQDREPTTAPTLAPAPRTLPTPVRPGEICMSHGGTTYVDVDPQRPGSVIVGCVYCFKGWDDDPQRTELDPR
jgi:hypothetical protein